MLLEPVNLELSKMPSKERVHDESKTEPDEEQVQGTLD